MLETKQKRIRRHRRIRAKIFGTDRRPRLCIFRSNRHIYAQLINDEKRKTIAVADDIKLKIKNKKLKIDAAKEVGKIIAEKAAGLNIEKVVFDRGGLKYHGAVKVLA